MLEAFHATAGERGFRHAQLCTHASNVRAQRLYEGRGWTVSGRKKLDDHGELVRHYIRAL